MRSLILAAVLACMVTSVQVQAQTYHSYPVGVNDPAFLAQMHAKGAAGRAMQQERAAQYRAAHPDHVIHRIGPDRHAERNAKHYNHLMGRCQTGDTHACSEAWGFRPQ
jgi:hypothetical protein